MRATDKSNKDYMLRVRMDISTQNKLDKLCKIYGVKRSEMTRILIDKEFELKTKSL